MTRMGHMTGSKTRKVYDHSGSTVVSLPADVLEEANLSLGDRVLVEAEDGQVVVNKARIGRAPQADGGGA